MGLFCSGGRCGLGRLNPPQLPIRRERGGGYLSGGSWMGICRPGGGVGGEATAGEKGGGARAAAPWMMCRQVGTERAPRGQVRSGQRSASKGAILAFGPN